MSDLSVNGVPVLRASLVLRRNGEWHGSVVLDTEVQPSNPLVIETAGGLRLTGWAHERGANEGRVSLEMVGGQLPGLATELGPVAYRPVGGVRVRTILEDWSRESGIALSDAIAPELLATFLPAWVRERGDAERAIRSLARALDCSWRFDSNGGLLLVRETWPEVDPDGVRVLERSTIRHTATVGTDFPLAELVPGVTWQGEMVSSAEVFVLADGSCRTRLMFEFPHWRHDWDRVAGEAKEPSWVLLDERRYSLTYLARVVTQSADLATVDVELEPDVDPEKRAMPGLVRVPLYAGIPGQVIELDIQPGGEPQFCIVTFLNGDRAKPIVSGWLGSPNNNAVNRPRRTRVRGMTVELGESGARKVARDADPVSASETFAAWVSSVSTIAGVPAPTGPIGEIADGSPYVKTD